MLEQKSIAVVIPAHDEEKLIGATISGVPGFVDRIIVVDDRSVDGTAAAVEALDDSRVELIRHERNQGVGAAIVTGYKRARDEGIDVTAVMAGDNQMDPADLQTLVEPVARGEVDYAKANRLFTGQAWDLIPRTRYLGNAVLSLLTKVASGYWHVADSQTGYTAISLEYLRLLDLDRIYRGYGMPNDMLVHLNIWNARVRDFPSRPIYNVGERSGIRLRKVVPRISWLLAEGLLLPDAREVRDPRLPPARLLLLPRLPDDDARARARDRRGRAAADGERDHDADHRPRRAPADLGVAVHALRDVVRHGVEQGPRRARSPPD